MRRARRAEAQRPQDAVRSAPGASLVSDLLQALIQKFAAGSYELAMHYVSCAECSVCGVAVDQECPSGKKLADEAWKKEKA